MLSYLFGIISDIIGFDFFEDWFEHFSIGDDVSVLMALTCCVLICLTVAFVFKFILKLVDR